MLQVSPLLKKTNIEHSIDIIYYDTAYFFMKGNPVCNVKAALDVNAIQLSLCKTFVLIRLILAIICLVEVIFYAVTKFGDSISNKAFV